MSPFASTLLLGALLSVAGGGVTGNARARPGGHALLDVPYVSQTPELCGGAAVAMVLRYWGEREVFAQDFASLVTASDGGILTGTLAAAVRGRGWQALVAPAAEEAGRARIRSELDQGRPLIALVEVAPRTYHYVVIVGSTDREVVLHDPARAPFRVLPWAEFDRAWMATGRWMMLILPPSGGPASAPVVPAPNAALPAATPTDRSPCAALVEHSIEMAVTGDRAGAEQGLLAATGFCPNDAATWRELAGLRFAQGRLPEAETLALVAARLAPEDAYAWQLLAATRYMAGDTMGALAAWNQTNEPRIDSIQIYGAARTPHPIVVRATGLQPRQVLTPEAFRRALRRVGEVPVASSARMTYDLVAEGPTDAGVGLADVNVSIAERKVVPRGWTAIGMLGARALLLREPRIDVAGLAGAGEVISVAWRWSTNRPRVALGLALPSPQWVPGVISIEGLWERQAYAPGALPAAAPRRETRQRVGLRLSDWLTSWLRWQAGGALDHLREYAISDEPGGGPRRYFAAETTVDVRLADERVAFALSGGSWTPISGGNGFTTGALFAAWRSTADATRPFWSAVTGVEAASETAPLASWSGAGTGHGRTGLLRAHPLLDHGVLAGPVFGRRVAHVSLEYARPVARIRMAAISIAGFVDAAQAGRRLRGLDTSALYVDAGIGVRAHAPGVGGAIRIDMAHGLRGGGTALSVGWGGAWPR